MSGFYGNLNKLNAFVRGLDKKYVTEVGVFADHNNRASKGKSKQSMTNAEIGAIHEFGSFSRHIPMRSFLRMPINMKSDQIVQQASRGYAELIRQGKLVLVMKRLGIAAENAIQQAFASRGFGTWKEDKPATVRRKGSSAPLIDTAQLRRAIASRVVPA